jgi:hypothetical protein
VGQLTWNILLNPVPGGETEIYDRLWKAPDDDLAWRKSIATDTYHKKMLEGRPFKVMMAVPGDLTFFNPRLVSCSPPPSNSLHLFSDQAGSTYM